MYAKFLEDSEFATASNVQKATPTIAIKSDTDFIDYVATFFYKEPTWMDKLFDENMLEIGDTETLLSTETELSERTGIRIFLN